MLDCWLDFHRATLEMKCAGLTPEQLARRSVPPSTMSLLGLVRHLAEVEQVWFERVDKRPHGPRPYSTAEEPDRDFDGATGDRQTVAEAFADWRRAIEVSRRVAAAHKLDDTFENKHGKRISLRWVMVHLIEEYARHNGHADLLRETIDGVTGE